jgi:hypothetical protein
MDELHGPSFLLIQTHAKEDESPWKLKASELLWLLDNHMWPARQEKSSRGPAHNRK